MTTIDLAPKREPRGPMRVVQRLASGTIIRQDFRRASRFVFFTTGAEEWQYATHGGTLFVALYRGKPYGLTCRHVFGTFNWGQLIVTANQFGPPTAGLQHVAYASNPSGAAIDTDVLDIAVVEFSDDVDASFFNDTAYLIDAGTVTTSRAGDLLRVHGALKTPSEITENTIAPKFALLELVDDTPSSNDPTLRRGLGLFDRPEFSDVLGLSGGPVFNVTQSALCGIAVRGTMQGNACTLWYVDIFDVCQLLAAVHDGSEQTYYNKVLTVPVAVSKARV